ncbi:MAG: AIPR family protein, partial [Staphylococcus epidermidis]|nr:AIPR family protein [Staphylococcus epidermidis]
SRKCFLYYVTPGTYREDDNHKATISVINERLLGLDIFKPDDIQINILDKDYIRKQYEKSKVQNTARFELSNKIELPYIENVSEAYFAIMPIQEFFKIIIDEEDGNIRKGIFELNVRDFGGVESNRVNQDIQATIDSDNKESFGLLNNGVTIVGSSLQKVQGKYTLKNFYIVNGCQTTNVLYENKDKVNPSMWISVKFVVTEKSDIIKDIVKATNNQTEVDEIQLLSMDEYQEYLESYYNSVYENKKLHYERREGQYRGNKDILESDIVTPEKQIKSFASIFLNAPHTASRFIGKLQDDISKRIFVKDDNPIIYYTAALVDFYLEELFINEKIDHVFKKFHQHLLFTISRIVFKNLKKPQHNAKQTMNDYCAKLIEAVSNESNFSTLVDQAKNILSLIIKNLDDTEANKNAAIVNSILKYVEVGITEEETNKISYLVSGSENLDWYIVPFQNVLIDGDLRYKLPDRYAELMRFLTSYSINSIGNTILVTSYNNLASFEDELVNIDLNERKVRKAISQKIIDETSIIKAEIAEIINKSKRY